MSEIWMIPLVLAVAIRPLPAEVLLPLLAGLALSYDSIAAYSWWWWVCKWNHMLVVFDAYLSTWKHSLHVSYFIHLLILFHKLAIFHREAKKRQISLIAPSRGSNSLSLIAIFTCARQWRSFCIVSHPLLPSILWEITQLTTIYPVNQRKENGRNRTNRLQWQSFGTAWGDHHWGTRLGRMSLGTDCANICNVKLRIRVGYVVPRCLDPLSWQGPVQYHYRKSVIVILLSW